MPFNFELLKSIFDDMKKVYLVLSFDYELPLGGCDDYNKGLFEPTNRLLGLAHEKEVPLAFFIDILSYKMFKQWGDNSYTEPFHLQVQEMLAKGHDAQLHIHPHWIASNYENESFIPSRKFKLADFKNSGNETDIEAIISESVQLMYEICNMESGDYKCIAYRGGGYNLSPETGRILNALFNQGIRIESSVVKGLFSKSDLRNEDYRKMPDLSNWLIDLDGDLRVVAKNGLLEIPVTTMPVFPKYRIERVIKKIKNKNYYKEVAYKHGGQGFGFVVDKLSDKIRNAYFAPLVLGFDNLTTDINNLKQILKYSLKKYSSENEIFLCANSHPKAFGDNQCKLMSDFINLIKDEYENLVEFVTYRDVFNMQNL